MDLLRIGTVFRAVRMRRGWRQVDVARRARTSRSSVARIEHGRADSVSLGTVQAVADALEVRLSMGARWHGGEADRLIDAGHAAMHEAMARRFAALPGWTAVPEASFSIFGERGVIDVLAWHAASRSLLVVELKTLLVDVSDLIGTMDRRRRLARRIAAERGWAAGSVSVWVVLGSTMTNRRRVERHRVVLRTAFPVGTMEMRRWLARPSGSAVAGLSFLSYAHQASGSAGRQRVRRPGVSQRRR